MNNSNSGQPQLPVPAQGTPTGMNPALEHYRLSQLYQYAMVAERLRGVGGGGSQTVGATAAAFFPPIRPELAPFLYSSYCRIDPRLALCRPPDEPKPQHSYIGLIAMAILGSPDKKLVLSDIYQYILDNYPYFRSRGPGWRNSIRHNLSLNDCFVKSGRSANGKGHYWAIHPANVEDFTKGDFRRRKAQRKVRKHMGLAVDDPDSPSPPPMSPPPVNWPEHPHHHQLLLTHPGRLLPPPHFPINPHAFTVSTSNLGPNFDFKHSIARHGPELLVNSSLTLNMNFNQVNQRERKRFDVASLLAPEHEILNKTQSGIAVSPASTSKSVKSEDDCDMEHCSSGTPSPPVSPICKAFKKLSPQTSEDDPGSDDDIEKERLVKTTSSNHGDVTQNDDTSKCDHHRNPKESFYPRSDDLRRPSSNHSGQCHHDNPKVSPTASGGHQPQDPVLHHHLGHPPVFPLGFNFSYPQHLIQHNPSLASLMLLSSRYREMTSEKYSREMTTKKSH